MLRRFSWFLLKTFIVLVMLTAILAALTFLIAPGTDVAVFTAPGHAAETAVEAGGSVGESSSMMAITHSNEPGFVTRLYGAGAFLVIDARVVTAGRVMFRWMWPAPGSN